MTKVKLNLSELILCAWSSGYERSLMFKGREFECRHCILDGHFSHLFAVIIVMSV